MKKYRIQLVGGDTTPKYLDKQEFARKLYKLMRERNWSAAETGRRSGIPRDAIGRYVRGISFPTPAYLDQLAETFGIKTEELMANYIDNAIQHDEPAFEIKASVNAPDKAWIRLNRLVDMATAVKIAQLLQDDSK